MGITVKTSNREIICSGSAMVIHGDYLEFVIKTLRFRLSFGYHDEEGRSFYQTSYVQADNPKDSYMEIKAFNFDRTTMNILPQPIALAQQDGRNLSLGLVVSSINRRNAPNQEGQQIEDKLVSYTWYLDLPQGNVVQNQ